MITKATYIARRGASLNALDLEIGRLTEYADKATENVAVNYHEAIHGLQATREKSGDDASRTACRQRHRLDRR